ncbi:hypothetical protein [Caloranaerobacter ferrireducens]|nr:hypothetical protein [Caloranaerobacter ferrireducens]
MLDKTINGRIHAKIEDYTYKVYRLDTYQSEYFTGKAVYVAGYSKVEGE